jgi:excisionase family DNA binding protein
MYEYVRICKMQDRFLTPEEVADHLAISPRTLKEWLRQGKMKGFKAGSLWRISSGDLKEFIDTHRTPRASSGSIKTPRRSNG